MRKSHRARFAGLATSVTALMAMLLATCDRAPGSGGRHSAHDCEPTADTARLGQVARDTIAKLRGRAQFVRRVTPLREGMSVRTEDTDSSSIHDGGLVSFGCDGRVTEIWLDGG